MSDLTTKDFKIATCQLSLFHSAISLPRSGLLKEVLTKFGDLFDGDPMSFPIPNDAPAEIPRVILTNKNPNNKLEICLNRTNLSQNDLLNGAEISAHDFFKKNKTNYHDFLNIIQSKVHRLAGVVIRYAFCENPGLFLARHFCHNKWDKEPFNRPESFELHSHKTFNLFEKQGHAPLIVNSWVRCKSGFRKEEGGGTSKIVLVEQDINTLQDANVLKTFSPQEIDDFFKAIPEKFDEIMKLYFPEGQA